MSTCSLIDDIFEFGGLKMNNEKNKVLGLQVFIIERNNNRIIKSLVPVGWIRTSDLRLMRTARWATSLPRDM